MSSTDPTAEERERMAAIAWNLPINGMTWDELTTRAKMPGGDFAEVRDYHLEMIDALRAAGFGDVAAERERADTLSVLNDAGDETIVRLTAERDRLQARIDAALRVDHNEYDRERIIQGMRSVLLTEDQPAATSEHRTRQEIPWPPFPDATYMLSAFVCSTCGWRGPAFRDGANYDTALRAARDQARLHEEHSAATPEPEHQKTVVDGEIEVCFACVNSEGNQIAWDQAHPAPEPPHLDPEPMESDGPVPGYRIGMGEAGFGGHAWRFNPREHDDNGKPYSQNRADYEGQS